MQKDDLKDVARIMRQAGLTVEEIDALIKQSAIKMKRMTTREMGDNLRQVLLKMGHSAENAAEAVQKIKKNKKNLGG